MPDQQPSADAPVQPNDADTAAAVSTAQDGGMGPGGGGLGKPAATGASPRGTAPNAPIDVPTPHPGGSDDGVTGSPRATTDAQAETAGSANRT